MEAKLLKIQNYINELKKVNRTISDELARDNGWLSDATRVRYIHYNNCRLEIIKQLEPILA